MTLMVPTIAICSHMAPSVREAGLWARENGTSAVDYSFDDLRRPETLSDDLRELEAVFEPGPFSVRYHCPFGKHELAHRDQPQAREALEHFIDTVDAVAAAGGTHVTVHMGLNSAVHGALDIERAVRSLSTLVKHGQRRGVEVCLENLRTGITSDPDTFLRVIEASGARATFDIGHAASSPVAEFGFGAADFARLVRPYIANAHIYEREGPGHIAPEDLSLIGEALTVLLDSPCDWWVVELTDHDEVRHTFQLLDTFLGDKLAPTPPGALAPPALVSSL